MPDDPAEPRSLQSPRPALPDRLIRRTGYLLSRLGATANASLVTALAPLGLHPRHYGAMVLLAEQQPVSQGTLADGLRLPRSRIVTIVDHLEALGAVRRRPDAADRRRHALHLTAHGRALLAHCDAIVEQFEQQRLACLSQAERAQLHALLARLAVHDPGFPGPSWNATDRRAAPPPGSDGAPGGDTPPD